MATVAEHGDGVLQMEEGVMKKIAFRIVTVSGGLLAMLAAGGAWVRG
jgi:hypothetical protein